MHHIDLLVRQQNVVLLETEEEKIDALDKWCPRRICGIQWNDLVTNEEDKPVASYLNYEEEALGPLWSCGKIGPSQWHQTCSCSAPSQRKRPPGMPWNSWLSVVSKDMKDAHIPDAVVMAEHWMHWKRVVAAHATPQEGMLPEWVRVSYIWYVIWQVNVDS